MASPQKLHEVAFEPVTLLERRHILSLGSRIAQSGHARDQPASRLVARVAARTNVEVDLLGSA